MVNFETINNTTFKISEDVRDTFIGDKDKEIFEPTIQVSPWEDEEDCLKIYKDISNSINKQTNLTDKSNLIWQDDNETWKIQPFGDYIPKGIKDTFPNFKGAQCLILINSKPTIIDGYARFEFKLSGHENMEFLSQPGKGEFGYTTGIPDWCEFSIAVYRKGKSWNSPGHTYQTGKVCHILRPWCEDNLGNFIWGKWELDIANGLITKLIPKEAFDKGNSWIVDDTIGNTGQGGSTGGWITDDQILLTGEGRDPEDTPADDGTVTKLTAWIFGTSGMTARNNRMALYDNSDDSFILGSGSDQVLISEGVDQEIDFTYTGAGPSVVTTIAYDIGVWGDFAAGNVEIYSDFASSAGKNDSEAYNGNPWPDPNAAGAVNRRFSLYCTYTPTVVGEEVANPPLFISDGLNFIIQPQ